MFGTERLRRRIRKLCDDTLTVPTMIEEFPFLSLREDPSKPLKLLFINFTMFAILLTGGTSTPRVNIVSVWKKFHSQLPHYSNPHHAIL